MPQKLTPKEKARRQEVKDWNRTKAIWDSLRYLFDSMWAEEIDRQIEAGHFKKSQELREHIHYVWGKELKHGRG